MATMMAAILTSINKMSYFKWIIRYFSYWEISSISDKAMW